MGEGGRGGEGEGRGITIRQQPPPKRIQNPLKKPHILHRGPIIQPVAVELPNARGGDDNALGEPVQEDIEREVEGRAERWGQTVVGRGVEGQEVGFGGGLGAG